MHQVTTLNTVERCYEAGEDYHMPMVPIILDFIARFLVVLNSSINFVIYCVFGSQFREELAAIVKKTCITRCSLRKVLLSAE